MTQYSVRIIYFYEHMDHTVMSENPHWIAVSTSFLDRPAAHRAPPLHRALIKVTAAASHNTIMSFSQPLCPKGY